MTIFAGILARHKDKIIPNSLISELRTVISRHPDDKNAVIEFTDNGIYLAKVDINVLKQPGSFSNKELTAFAAGDPLYQTNPSMMPGPRAESLQNLAFDLAAGKLDALYACRGTYCAVIYEHANSRLHLVTDKLGVRPVYYWVLPDFIIFSTALRILEALSFQKKSLNLQGVAEIACFGYPLSDRSPYENIFTLYAGETISFSNETINRQKYWEWDKLPIEKTSDSDIGTSAKHLHTIFIDSVKIRLQEQKTVAAFLSGGLDSRAIVGALKSLDVEIVTSNFAPLGSQDQVFGQLAAEKLGTHHTHLQIGKQDERDSYHKLSVNKWINSTTYTDKKLPKPRVIWSGDGGSVGLGHVYLNPDIIQASRKKDMGRAKKEFFTYNNCGISTKLLKPKIASTLINFLNDGIQSELDSIHSGDPGRIFYLFLMLNDQRRHMFNHFENIDLGRVEFELPFFDSNFIAEIIKLPIDPFLRHVFYMEWLSYFPKAALEVPWQAYPGHMPCPLPQPEGLTYQWNSSTEATRQNKLHALKYAKELSRDSVFSHQYLNLFYLRLWIILMRFRQSDRSYLLQTPGILYRYWSKVAPNNKNQI
ncbi:Asparagine synthetase B (glutamine-hydrolyzing) [Nitrosomonas eutropha]|uniref:asparagine synthase-related protein n=1 Tax=Nitrosomonas eutropha TaxID=916 RepID=UPI0008800DCC|nr:asparagine synthase-related protein [Nitrosomonas eutropha]SCX18035.1 Asparagine synthetase B (glutamine-hydrolyzing) [Nitrosomonas eutropha]